MGDSADGREEGRTAFPAQTGVITVKTLEDILGLPQVVFSASRGHRIKTDIL